MERRYRVLVVDDEVDLCEMLSLYLETEGYEPITCTDPRKAVDLALQERPDLILLDLMLPYCTAADVLERLRQLPRTAHIPVILITAATEAHRQARELGLRIGVQKPFDLTQLDEAVADALGLVGSMAQAVLTSRLAC